jgi:hypothetical protein
MPAKTAAIEADKLDDTPLQKLSAAEFVEALQAREAFGLTHFWPEKKKYELELEPGVLGKLRFRDFVDILDRIRGEKKKVEYEIPDWWRWRINPDPTPWRFEPNPQPSIARQLDQLAMQLKGLSDRVDQIAGK